MSTVTRDRVRRGLPRVPGGEPWPPVDEGAEAPVAEVAVAEVAVAERPVAGPTVAGPTVAAPLDVPPVPESLESFSSPHPPRDATQRMHETVAVALPSAPAPASPGAQRAVRRGLPRVPGGEPWPSGSVAAPSIAEAPPQHSAGVAASDPRINAGEQLTVPRSAIRPQQSARVAASHPQSDAGEQPSGPDGAVRLQQSAGVTASDPQPGAGEQPSGYRTLRRGLPRVSGGEPWPPASAPASATSDLWSQPNAGPASNPQDGASEQLLDPTRAVRLQQSAGVAASDSRAGAGEQTGHAVDAVRPQQSASDAAPDPQSAASQHDRDRRALRRGLPRMPGAEPWPPSGFAPAPANTSVAVAEAPAAEPVEASTRVARRPIPADGRFVRPATAAPGTDLNVPLPFPRTVFTGAAASEWNAQRRGETSVPVRPATPRRGPFTRLQWAGAVIVGGGALLAAAVFAVLIVRWFVSLDFMREFLATYPGEYELPEAAPVGFPAWLAWQHFFNVFLIVLIIRTGISVHNEKRPGAFWSPRTNRKRKISLTLWLHQSLDILWLVNGVAYVVLLFATAQWMRIVPTSWEVFPNALSAGLQYVSLVWPTENGWVNYNSLQQLAYFATVFIAAPLATITGVRMSGVWPKNAETLNRLYPVEWARKVHFPVMVYFVAFIIVHVALVLATNALRNLNHMYGGQDAVNWTGFWIFLASMVVVAAGWVAARPLVLAPIARLFGTVSSR